MAIKNHNYQMAKFVISAPDIRHLPKDTGIEVAFAGNAQMRVNQAL